MGGWVWPDLTKILSDLARGGGSRGTKSGEGKRGEAEEGKKANKKKERKEVEKGRERKLLGSISLPLTFPEGGGGSGPPKFKLRNFGMVP